jgi:hypothetical protein
MSKNILIIGILFSLTLSLMITQEANALTRGSGNDSRTTASLDPSKVCGNHICGPGDHHKWSSAIQASQREGPGKAAGGHFGDVIMHQLVVNSVVKTSHANSAMNNAPISK